MCPDLLGLMSRKETQSSPLATKDAGSSPSMIRVNRLRESDIIARGVDRVQVVSPVAQDSGARIQVPAELMRTGRVLT